MDLGTCVLVVLAGVAAGFINMMAGSGSLITLPVLIFAGLPATVANGTNRIAILLQNIVGVRGFHKEKVLDFNRGRWLLVPTVLGSLAGAQIAVELDEKMMRLSIACVMIVMLFVILIKPNQWLHGHPERAKSKPAFPEIVVFFFVGVYGGFIQAGVGIFLLSALVLGAGYDLVRANAVKLLIVLVFTPFALFIFIVNHQVHWEMGLILALGNMTGAWLGTRVAVKGGAAMVRWVLMAVILASASKLIWDLF